MARIGTKKTIKKALIIGSGAFILALVVTLISKGVMDRLTSTVVAIIILLLIIVFGVLLDLVGTAVTAADEQVFHAMATRRVAGGAQGAFLVRHADSVANICNDVVGDVASAISGALGAGLALLIMRGSTESLLPETLIMGLVAALTVGGKALGKSFAIKKANRIIFFVGKVMARLHINVQIKDKKI